MGHMQVYDPLPIGIVDSLHHLRFIRQQTTTPTLTSLLRFRCSAISVTREWFIDMNVIIFVDAQGHTY